MQLKFVEKTGAWFAYNGSKIGQGKTNAIRYLDEHPEVADELEAKIRDYYKQHSDYADTVEIGTTSNEGENGADGGNGGGIDSLDPLDDISEEELVTQIPDDL